MSFALSVTQPAPACSEHELVAAVRHGSDQAFEELYTRYRPRIGSYILGMVGDHARAEDIAQEVFISALRRLRETDQAIAFKPWIYEIAKNACIDEFRRSRRLREVPLESDSDDEAAAEPVALRSPVSTDSALECKQSLADLRGAFEGLSETHHQVLVMRELEGRSYAQIGEQLGMSRAMVESTLFRARRRLTAEYDELASGRRCEQVQELVAEEPPALRKLGVRQRRQIARHLSHCQPCRRHARAAGLDESFFNGPSRIGKIAALLPIPWLRWRRSSEHDNATASSGAHSYSAVRSMQIVARLVDPSGASAGFGRAAAAAAAIAVAAIGGGVAGTVAGQPAHPTQQTTTAAAHPSHVTGAHGAGAAQRSGAASHRRAASSGSLTAATRHRAARSNATTAAPSHAASHSTTSTAPRSGAAPTTTPTSGSGSGSQGGGGGTHDHLPSLTSPPAITTPKLPIVGQLTTPTLPTKPPQIKLPQPVVPKVQLPNPKQVVKKLLGG